MNNQKIDVTIFKGKNPDKISVYRACSLEEEIRFYLNPSQYVSARENENNGISIELREEGEEKEVQRRTKKKLEKEDYLKLILLCLGLSAAIGAVTLLSLIIASYLNSMLVYLILFNTFLFVLDIIRVVVLESSKTSPRVKSKHSAEHMLVNFLEKYRRLPKSIKEAKKASRFSTECGSRDLINGIAEKFVSKIVASFLAVAMGTICTAFFNNLIIEVVIFVGVYLVVEQLLIFLFKKFDKFDALLNPVKRLLTIIAQYANTTKRVKDEDIYLAYLAAREWIQIVYPEYYNKEQDVFLESI